MAGLKVDVTKGAVVELQSGGPRMTAADRREDGWWVCHWFDGITVREHGFPDASLRVVPDPELFKETL